MALTLTLLNAGAERELKLFLNNGGLSLEDLRLRLYVNNHTPAVTDTASDYTICTLAGYSNINLSGGTWSVSTSSGVADGTYTTQTFTFTAGGQTIYGVVLTDQSNNPLAAGLLDTPFTVPSLWGSLTVAPEIKDKQTS